MKHLVLGGARSGKSRFAQSRAAETGLPVTYIATAAAGDGEMAERIERHRSERPSTWRVVEEPLRLGDALRQEAVTGRCVVVDCITLWLSNHIGSDDVDNGRFEREREALLRAVEQAAGELILVSNEVGLGIVPANAVARAFRDEAGRINQALARRSERVTLVVAGLPLALKS